MATMREQAEQIRRSHKSAQPKDANPAWKNTLHDLGVVLAYVDELERALEPFALRYEVVSEQDGPTPKHAMVSTDRLRDAHRVLLTKDGA